MIKKKGLHLLLALQLFSWYGMAQSVYFDRALDQVGLLLDQGGYLEADTLLQSLLEKRRNGAEKISKAEMARLHLLLGKNHYRLGRYETAARHLSDAAGLGGPIWTVQDTLRLDTYLHLFRVHVEEGYLKKAKSFLDTVAVSLPETPASLMAADIYDAYGRYHLEARNMEQAREVFDRAKAVRERSTAASAEQWKSFRSAGLYQFVKGNRSAAEEHLKNALQRLETNEGNEVLRAEVLLSLGNVYAENGELDRAVEQFQEGKRVFQQYLPGDHPSFATVYGYLGGVARRMGTPDKALGYFSRAVAVLEPTGDALPRYSLGLILHDQSLVFAGMGDYERARVSLERGISILEAYPDIRELRRNYLFNAYATLADLEYYQGNYQGCIDRYKKLIDEIKNTYGEHSIELIRPYNSLGLTYSALGNYPEAENLFATAYPVLGIKAAADQPFETLTYVDGAINTIWNRAENFLFWYKAKREQDKLRKATAEYEFYLDLVDHLRTGYKEEGAKLGLAAENRIAYERAIVSRFLLTEFDSTAALFSRMFDYSERSRALTLLEAFRRAQVEAFEGLPGAILAEEQRLQDTLRALESTLFTIRQQPGMQPESIGRLESSLFSQKEQYYAFLEELRQRYPAYYRLKYDPEVIQVDVLQDVLRADTSVLVEYFLGDQSSYIFLVHPDTVIVEHLGETKKVKQLVTQFTNSLYTYWSDPTQGVSVLGESVTVYDSVGWALYQKLIEPIAAYLEEKVIIVPDGQLSNLPFEVLLTELPRVSGAFRAYPFLVKDHRITYAPSATLYEEMRGKSSGKGSGWLGFAPAYEGKPLAISSRSGQTDTLILKSLKYNRDEVEAVAALTGGQRFLGTAATKSAFLQSAESASMLHLSLHAAADNLSGERTFLAFEDLSGEVGASLLFIPELYNLSIPADLVILSACETGIGRLLKGEGIISLARAFAYAGAKGILMTLWSVDDRVSRDLMVTFYEEIQKGWPADAALQRAKLRMLEQGGRQAHPYFWSGFIGAGDMEYTPD